MEVQRGSQVLLSNLKKMKNLNSYQVQKRTMDIRYHIRTSICCHDNELMKNWPWTDFSNKISSTIINLDQSSNSQTIM